MYETVMDYQFYEFMNKAKNEGNRAIIEGIQKGYLLCEYSNGNITKAQYENALADLVSAGVEKVAKAADKVVEKFNTAGSVAKRAALAGGMAAAMGAMTGCAGSHHPVKDRVNDPNGVIVSDAELAERTEALNAVINSSDTLTLSNQQLADLGLTCVQIANKNIMDNPTISPMSTEGWKSLDTLYKKVSNGTLRNVKMASAQQNPDADEGERQFNRELNIAHGSLVGPMNHEMKKSKGIAPDFDFWAKSVAKAKSSKNNSESDTDSEHDTPNATQSES